MNSREKQALRLIHKEIEKALDLLVDSCERTANKFESKSIPVEYVRQARNILLKGILKGSRIYSKEEVESKIPNI